MKRSLRQWLVVVGLITTFGPAPVAQAQPRTYYVATTGSDSSPGTFSQPWATLQHAGETAEPGDTVLVRGGTYTEGEIWLRSDYGHCGSAAGGLVTIRAYPGEAPLFTNAVRSLYISCDYLRIEGLRFTNGKSIAIWGLDRTTIQLVSNRFTGSGYAYDAISTEGNNILLEGNVCDIEGNTQGTQGHCYYIHHGTNITLRNNLARGMTGYGIHVFDQRRSEDPSTFTRLIKDVVIEGNVAYESEQRSGLILAASDGARIENVVVRNNLFFNNPVAGINLSSDARAISIDHNTLVNNGLGGILIYGPGTLQTLYLRNNLIDLGSQASAKHIDNQRTDVTPVVDHNLYWPAPARLTNASDTAPITGNPHFVNGAAGDFHLGGDSAAIDSGLALAQVVADRDGVVRPRGAAYDVGAYEFVPALALWVAPGDGSLRLGWSVSATLPITSTWRISYTGPAGDQPSPITGIANTARAHTLTGLTNDVPYTVTLTAMLAGTPLLTDTVTVRPTARLTYLPIVRR
ncbi:MAG TPA: right-handed parallel beta-helix repeat-containing protein [Anaerolineales bacterium]|nr:right-handed parallel beta-helix repeat-containing protein [Anaerolineales bacterium]